MTLLLSMFYVAFLFIPAATLAWRAIVSKQKIRVRAGAAVCAMLTVVGAIAMPQFVIDGSETTRLETARDGLSVLAAASGPIYLLFWSRKHRGRGQSRTISIIAAVIGLVPIAATLATALIFAGGRP